MGAGCAKWKNHSPSTITHGLLKAVSEFRSEMIGLNMRIANVQEGNFFIVAIANFLHQRL
jgi:hypothetical protein